MVNTFSFSGFNSWLKFYSASDLDTFFHVEAKWMITETTPPQITLNQELFH